MKGHALLHSHHCASSGRYDYHKVRQAYASSRLSEPITKGLAIASSNTILRLLHDGAFAELAYRLLRRTGFQQIVSPKPLARQAVPAPPIDTASPPRIAFFSHSLTLDGAPLSLLELVSGLKSRGLCSPTLYAPTGGPVQSRYRANGIEVILTTPPSHAALTRAGFDALADNYASLIRDLRPSVVVANTLRAFDAIDAARIADIPSVWIVRESEPWQSYFADMGYGIQRRALACFQYPKRLVFVSEACRRVYGEIDRQDRFKVIRNVPDPTHVRQAVRGQSREQARASLGVSADEVLVISVGTVSENKGQIDLVEAIARLPAAAAARVRACIVGDRPGQYSRQLRRSVAGLPIPLRSRIAIVPSTDEVGRYYTAADIFVLTSRSESYPRVVLEAKAHGLAIAAAPVQGVIEQLADGENALFYPSRDVAALAEALSRLIGDKSLRRRLGSQASLGAVDEQAFETMIQEYASVMRDCIVSA